MDLILWRHADAEDGVPDLERRLTKKGREQAERMAKWLRPLVGPDWLVLVSPAKRTLETIEPLDMPFEVREALGTWTTAEALLGETGWPESKRSVLVVGHQPTLGQVAAQLLGGSEGEVAVKKGAAWWFATRERAGRRETTLKAVMNPDLLG